MLDSMIHIGNKRVSASKWTEVVDMDGGHACMMKEDMKTCT